MTGLFLPTQRLDVCSAFATEAISLLEQFPDQLQPVLRAAMARDDEHEVTLDAENNRRAACLFAGRPCIPSRFGRRDTRYRTSTS